MWPLADVLPSIEAGSLASMAYVREMAWLVGLLTLASLSLWGLVGSRIRYPLLCLVLFALHSAWTMESDQTGRDKHGMSGLFGLLASSAVAAQLISCCSAAIRGEEDNPRSPIDPAED